MGFTRGTRNISKANPLNGRFQLGQDFSPEFYSSAISFKSPLSHRPPSSVANGCKMHSQTSRALPRVSRVFELRCFVTEWKKKKHLDDLFSFLSMESFIFTLRGMRMRFVLNDHPFGRSIRTFEKVFRVDLRIICTSRSSIFCANNRLATDFGSDERQN